MSEIVVRTKSELKEAVKMKHEKIIVKGALAETLNSALKIRKLSKITLGVLSAAVITTPFSGALSTAAAAPIAASTGLEAVTIIAVSFLGLSLILEIFKDYKKAKFKVKTEDYKAELHLEK
jgi:hypothetical protein